MPSVFDTTQAFLTKPSDINWIIPKVVTPKIVIKQFKFKMYY